MEVAKGIHRLTRGVVNFYLIEDGGKLLVVDAGTPRDWPELVRAVSAVGRTPEDVEDVLLTHAHSDHTGFAEHARTSIGAEVWVHHADALVARTGKRGKNDDRITAYLLRREFYRTTLSLLRRGAGRIVPIHEVTTFADGATLDLPGRPRVLHAPGHTEGSCALFLERGGVLLTGDVLATRNPLTGRLGPQIMPSGLNRDTPQALRSLDAIEAIPAGVVLPGHGEPWIGGAPEAVRLARRAGPS